MNYGYNKMLNSHVALKICSVILCVIMLFELFPTVAEADWIENGQKCDLCEEWDEDDAICDDCGCHYNDECCEFTHCPDCGDCLMEVGDFCDECGRCPDCQNVCAFHCMICGEHIDEGICDDCNCCEDCALAMGFHCSLCGECMAGSVDACPTHGDNGDESHCVNCGLICVSCGECFIDDPDWYNEELNMCLDCGQDYGVICVECLEYSSEICEVCNLCPGCAEANGYHCPECGECTMLDWPCPDGGDHCIYCCEDNGWLCPQCGHCAESCGIDICPHCGLCEICCAENAEAEGCTCGDVCKESGDWEEHFCAECGQCFDDVDRCDDCGLCTECCAAISADEGCSSGEICVASSEWSNHFCEECGDCFCEKDYCDICGLCTECCESISECSEGMCVEDSDYEDHFCSQCGKCFHETEQCEECDKNGEHICLECCENASHTAKLSDSSEPKIIRQPADYYGACSTNDNMVKATFTVRLKNPDGATYQWQEKKAGGNWTNINNANSNTLTVNVGTKACLESNFYQYRCIIKNKNGTTTSDAAGIYGEHKYGSGYVCDSTNNQHGHVCVYCGTVNTESLENHKFGQWTTVKEATSSSTGTAERTCAFCGYKETKTIAKVHTHKWSTTWGHTYDSTKDYYDFHFHVCLVSGCGAITDLERHTFGDLVVTTYPTETKAGEGYRECTVCGHRITETIAKLAHTHDYLEEDYDESEYTKSVYQKLGTYNEFYHWQICQKKVNGKVCGYVHNKSFHDYNQWYYADDEETTLVRYCSTCGYEQTYKPTAEEKTMYLISVKGGEATVNGKPVMFVKAGETVTVTVYGVEKGYFSKGYVFKTWDPANLTGITFTTGTLTSKTISFTMPAYNLKIAALAKECTHTLGRAKTTAQDPSSAIEAGCFTNGKHADVVCTQCGKVVREGSTIEAYGCHDYVLDESTVKAATCTTCGYTGDMVCTRCGDVQKGTKIAKTEHTYSETKVITPATCHSIGHYGQTCTVCGLTKLGETIPRLEHTASSVWSTDEISHWKVCADKDCDAIAVKKAAHEDSNGDYLCDVCHYNMRPENEFIIRFEPNRGTCRTISAVTNGKRLSILPTAKIEGDYAFAGWYTEAENGTAVTKNTVITEDMTLYAHWRYTGAPVNHSVTLGDTGNGAVNSDVETAAPDDVVTLTLTPDEGYVPDAIKVTVEGGEELSVTKVSDTVYTFIMPDKDVSISVTFKEEQAPQTDEPDAETTSTPKTDATPAPATAMPTKDNDAEGKKASSTGLIILLIIAIALVIGVAIFMILKKKRKVK